MRAVRVQNDHIKDDLWYYCRGCRHNHFVPLHTGTWSFNGSLERPTLTPSVRHFETYKGKDITICHYFIRDGRIEYCCDCQHVLSGQSFDLDEVEPHGDSCRKVQ